MTYTDIATRWQMHMERRRAEAQGQICIAGFETKAAPKARKNIYAWGRKSEALSQIWSAKLTSRHLANPWNYTGLTIKYKDSRYAKFQALPEPIIIYRGAKSGKLMIETEHGIQLTIRDICYIADTTEQLNFNCTYITAQKKNGKLEIDFS